MTTTGLPELWHSALAFLSHQPPFGQIMLVTLAALFVVMALEGLRSSISAIWRAHRTSAPQQHDDAPVRLAAPSAAGPRSRSFTAKPRAPSSRPKAADHTPRQFRAARPTIRRIPSSAPAEGVQHQIPEVQSGESDSVVELAAQ
ncbi:MAG: hypothetical protein ISS15_01305 [Alphaproteobacteria bacterium]|nr:hypothetical protein [Alphaproteobacteria bacterium]MBL6937170.1 hypothetical protein [Alphaproteobacteria bacterium]MBL7096268.1 hypothetical protein [Alphaproteobacteria bacterium]